MRLTEHFTLKEFTITYTGIANLPNVEVIGNLKLLAEQLEYIRFILCTKTKKDIAIIITSGYRCPEVNAYVGASRASAHLSGLAADFVAPQFGTPRRIAEIIRDSVLEFDQLIFGNTWVHLSIDPRMRKQVLTKVSGDTTYVQGIV